MKFKDDNEMFINLEKYVPEGEAWDVMYMGTTIDNIDLYKHICTRNYINIDDDGNFYKYNCNDDNYTKIEKDIAINWLLS